ncbi:acyltransferase [Ructibacterium gallinarum]|uniref:Transacetylase n=1 Tax=Ructibacterium gallinarum TaxID=2779355 RepID=A0A9D5M2C8_9FIRM|nr:acyltransferase [Ructibacterium gallinarum]MBE5039335.1 transacetylase [Ructibacterium gallinarum]
MGKVELRNSNIVIGKNVCFRGDIILDGDGPIVIGDDVRINHGCYLLASKDGGITIGSKTGIAPYTYIIDMDHGTKAGDNYHTQPDIVKKVVIGKNVWIAQNCTILKGSVIGDNAVCAAKTVITGKQIPENAIVAGIPGRVIKYKN